MKTKILLIIFCITSSLVVFGQDDPQLKLLTEAYKKNSVELMTEFLNNWVTEVPPMSEDDFFHLMDTIKNDTIKEAYKIYSLCRENYKWYVQDKLIVYVTDTFYCDYLKARNIMSEKIKTNCYVEDYLRSVDATFYSYYKYIIKNSIKTTYEITDFRPFISKWSFIYNKKYRDIINNFLHFSEKGKNEYIEMKKRGDFLDKYNISIYAKYWNNGGFFSAPRDNVAPIIISKDLKSAVIIIGGDLEYLIKVEDRFWRICKTIELPRTS